MAGADQCDLAGLGSWRVWVPPLLLALMVVFSLAVARAWPQAGAPVVVIMGGGQDAASGPVPGAAPVEDPVLRIARLGGRTLSVTRGGRVAVAVFDPVPGLGTFWRHGVLVAMDARAGLACGILEAPIRVIRREGPDRAGKERSRGSGA